ncbi:MAG TPA: CorA family divalent cation transporter [Candidatus Dormibacteraeota bacterium]|nr:CorA family divalent cation transporter [Candidatus Dormibacteraeota bacterium]
MTHDDAPQGVHARLFDSDRTDRALTFDEALKARISGRQLLWVDLAGETDPEQSRALAQHLELDVATERALEEGGDRPEVQLHGQHFHLRVAAQPDPANLRAVPWLDIVAAPNVVISSHTRPLEFLRAMNKRIAADATIGELDSAEFVAALLDAILTTYHAAIDELESELDDLDSKALGRRQPKDLFDRLVAVRRRIGGLRRLFAAHRELFGALGGKDFGTGISSADPDVFAQISDRYSAVLASLEGTRDAAVASFDILMTRTAQRTNDVVRVLTVATVMAIPASLSAGFLGMNVLVPFPKDDPTSFWLILGAVLVVEIAIFVVARVRAWI